MSLLPASDVEFPRRLNPLAREFVPAERKFPKSYPLLFDGITNSEAPSHDGPHFIIPEEFEGVPQGIILFGHTWTFFSYEADAAPTRIGDMQEHWNGRFSPVFVR